MKTLLFTALAVTAMAVQLSAGTVSVTFTGANGQTDKDGYLISPYTAKVGGVSTTIYCDDFANNVQPGQTYTANETNLGSGNLSLTRYGNVSASLATKSSGTQTFDAQQLYDMAAWLTTQFTTNGSQNGNIQDTLWDLFNPAGNSSVHPPTPSSNSWLFAAESNYSSINASNFMILTNTNAELAGKGQVQEFIVPNVAQAPEPASLGLLGLGLVVLSIVGRRKLFPVRGGALAEGQK